MKSTNKKLSIPYNNDYQGTIKIMREYSSYIKEVYFPINPEIIGSGRGTVLNDYHDDYIKVLIGEAKRNNIKSNMIVNPIGLSEIYSDTKQFNKMIDYIKYYSDIFLLEYVTVTNPILAKALSKVLKYTKIVASVNMFINSLEGIKKAAQLGITEIYIDRERNYDINFIKAAKKEYPNINFRLMLNEGCLPNCLFRVSHFDSVAMSTQGEIKENLEKYNLAHFDMGCRVSYGNEPELSLKTTTVRPEDIKYYEEIIDTFKIVGRTTPTYINELRVKAYSSQNYNGDYLKLIDNPIISEVFSKKKVEIPNKKFPDNYMEVKFNCTKNCFKCDYCKKLYKEIIN